MSVKPAALDGLAARLAQLNSEQRALLSQKLKALPAAPAGKILPRAMREEAPLSFAQERLWLLAQLQPESALYTIAAAFKLAGALDRHALASAVNAVAQRHAVLRTVFSHQEGSPRQRIKPAADISIPLLDLSGMDSIAQANELRRLAQLHAQQAFDLGHGPLLRISLVYLGQLGAETEHALLFAVHHSVFDGWSMGVFIQEFASLYSAFLSRQPPDLPVLPIQYADYAAWQRETLSPAALKQQTAYWLDKLHGLPPLLELPTDRPRPPVQKGRGATLRFAIAAEIKLGLQSIAKSSGATLFMVLLAAFKILLARHTGRDDIFVGTPIAGRTRSELEKLIGCFVNTQVLRTSVAGNPDLPGFIQRLKQTCVEAQSHQDVPFEKLVEALRPTRNLAHSPLFQVMFVLQNAPLQALDIEGLRIQPLAPAHASAKFDLTLELAETSEGLDALLEYDADLFNATTIERIAGHYQTLLRSFITQPDGRLADLAMLTASETRQMDAWNATARAYKLSLCIHELVERQANCSADAVAVSFGAATLSYAELNTRANRLSHYLRNLGAGPDQLVAIHLERSLELVIGLLGILKAGAAYVPLDVDYPPQRLAYMLADSNIKVLLTQAALAQRLPGAVDTVVCLDSDWPLIAAQPPENPPKTARPLNLAYVIYTSGSTGQPKGAALAHRGVVNRLLGMQEAYHLEPGDRVLQKTPFSFDVSVWEFFWPLSVGAELVVAPPGVHKEAAQLAQLIQQKNITTLHFVPSMLNAFLDAPGVESCRSLRRVICSGEALPPAVCQRFHAKLEAQLHNLYGPTEASIDVTAWACQPGEAGVPIGRPVPNAQIHLSDRQGQRVPAGVAGELHIGGVQLARGYINKPGLTAERFIPDPWGEPGARLYQTGDLAKYRPDGAIEYLGRLDHQVKIRGFRIELGEIEARLGACPGVQEALAMVREEAPGHPCLVAYAAGPAVPAADALRTALAADLPEHMLPSCIIRLERLPLNPNGKVDRKALPAPDRAAPPVARVAPRNPTETQLAAIWAGLLGIDPPSVNEDFFALGGNSLLANQLAFKIEQAFGAALPVRTLFAATTIAAQADCLGGRAAAANPGMTDLDAEARLDESIRPAAAPSSPAAAPQAVLLTGVTGFLGAFLADELLKQTGAKVYCLIRAGSPAEAAAKMHKNLARYGLDSPQAAKRLCPVLGDIALPKLGMAEAEWQALSLAVDAVYHNAAIANFIQPYALMKPANVGGTLEALRFACAGRAKFFHHVSTVSVFGEAQPPSLEGFAEADFPPGVPERIGNGYAQSKWVAEQLVRRARQRGVPASIYRPAMISGHSATGAWNTEDFLCRAIKACAQLGRIPAHELQFNLVPVDYASRALVYLSLQESSPGQTFHLSNPALASSQALAEAAQAQGWAVERVPFAAWQAAAREAASASSDFALAPFLSLLEGEGEESSPAPHYQCEETLKALARGGIACPPIDADLLGRYFRHFAATGFIAR